VSYLKVADTKDRAKRTAQKKLDLKFKSMSALQCRKNWSNVNHAGSLFLNTVVLISLSFHQHLLKHERLFFRQHICSSMQERHTSISHRHRRARLLHLRSHCGHGHRSPSTFINTYQISQALVSSTHCGEARAERRGCRSTVAIL
jgi:hypothetical protein